MSLAKNVIEALVKANIEKAIKNSLNDIDLGDVLSRTLKNNIKNSITGKSFRGLNDTDIKLKLKEDIRTSLDDVKSNETDLDNIYNNLDPDDKRIIEDTSIDEQTTVAEILRRELDDINSKMDNNVDQYINNSNIFSIKQSDNITELVESKFIDETMAAKLNDPETNIIPEPNRMDDIPDNKINEKMNELTDDLNDLDSILSSKTDEDLFKYGELTDEVTNKNLFQKYGKLKFVLAGGLVVFGAILFALIIYILYDRFNTKYYIRKITKYTNGKVKLSLFTNIKLCNNGKIKLKLDDNVTNPSINGDYNLSDIFCVDNSNILITPSKEIESYPLGPGNYGHLIQSTSFIQELNCQRESSKACIDTDDYIVDTNDDEGGDGGDEGGDGGDEDGGGDGNDDGDGNDYGDGGNTDNSLLSKIMTNMTNFIKNKWVIVIIIFIILIFIIKNAVNYKK
jgi:hypothetical protein